MQITKREGEYKITSTGTYYHKDTPDAVIELLELARDLGYWVWFRYGDPAIGRDWMDDCDVCGFIGRSGGPVKVPLLLKSRRSTGGPALLEDRILRIIVKGGGRLRTWTHHNYMKPDLAVVHVPGEASPWRVIHKDEPNGQYEAGFKTREKAQRWADFITGKRLNK